MGHRVGAPHRVFLELPLVSPPPGTRRQGLVVVGMLCKDIRRGARDEWSAITERRVAHRTCASLHFQSLRSHYTSIFAASKSTSPGKGIETTGLRVGRAETSIFSFF